MVKKWQLVIVCVMASWFASLAGGAVVMDTFPGDIVIERAVQSVQSGGLTKFFEAIHVLGETWVPVAGYIAAIAVLWSLRARLEALLLPITAVPVLLNLAIKVAVGRPRPTDDMVRVLADSSGFGFPSGHVVLAMIFFGTLFYLTWRIAPKGTARAVLMALWGTIIALTGLSRLYLGAHWPSDVLGGYVFGGLNLGIMIIGYEWVSTRVKSGRASATVDRAAVNDS